MQDAAADVLADARRTLEALKSSGVSREALLQMWEAGDKAAQQQQQQLQLQLQHQQQQQHHQQQHAPQDVAMEDASTRGLFHSPQIICPLWETGHPC